MSFHIFGNSNLCDHVREQPPTTLAYWLNRLAVREIDRNEILTERGDGPLAASIRRRA